MSLRGSIKTMPVEDLFDWVDRKLLRGEIFLERGTSWRRFQVYAGRLTSAGSNDPTEYLGQILLNSGDIDETALKEAMAAQTSRGMALGKILLVSQLINEEALRTALETKIKEGVYDALSWTDGTFAFEPDNGTSKTIEFEVAVPFRMTMTEGGERAEAWKKVRELIPADDTRFFVPDRLWVDRAKPGSPSALLLGDVMRGLTVREIILERHSLPFPVYQRLSELMTRGIVQIDRRTTPRNVEETENPMSLIIAAKGRAKGGDRGGAVELARRAATMAPGDEGIKKALGDLERSLFAELSRALLTKYRVPKLLKRTDELDGLSLSAEERYLVGRIDGRWDLLSLMRVSPLREVEALLTFKRLAERGVISLD